MKNAVGFFTSLSEVSKFLKLQQEEDEEFAMYNKEEIGGNKTMCHIHTDDNSIIEEMRGY